MDNNMLLEKLDAGCMDWIELLKIKSEIRIY
jgi:hypothetical protein